MQRAISDVIVNFFWYLCLFFFFDSVHVALAFSRPSLGSIYHLNDVCLTFEVVLLLVSLFFSARIENGKMVWSS